MVGFSGGWTAIIPRLDSNIFDVVGQIITSMENSTKEDKNKKTVPAKPPKDVSQEAGDHGLVEKEGASGGRDNGNDRGSSQPTGEQPTLNVLAESLVTLTQSLQCVQQNQQEMVNVMLEAGAAPYFEKKGKGKGVGKSSTPRADFPARKHMAATAVTQVQVPAKSHVAARRDMEQPQAKRARRDHEMSDRESEVDFSDGELSDGDVEFTSDEIEHQIDEFLRTAQDTLIPRHPQHIPAGNDCAAAGYSGALPPVPLSQTENDAAIAEALDDSLRSFAQDLTTDEDVGPEVSTQLADIMSNLLGKKLSDEKIKTRIDENAPPSNIPLLQPPRVNECIWELLKSGPRSSDIRMRKIQVRLTRGLSALARLADKLLECKKKGSVPDLADSLNQCLQSFALIGNANYELSLRRRETLRSQLNSKYSRLCYQSTPVTTLLFGDDITKRVEDITKVQKLGENITQRYRNQYEPSNRGYGNRGGGYRGRGRGSYRGGQRGGNSSQSKNGKWRGNAKKANNRQ